MRFSGGKTILAPAEDSRDGGFVAACKKDGFQEATYKIESHFNGATAGNILAGGIIGMGVDAATGANYNFPAEVKIPMTAIQNPGVATDSKPSETTVLVAPGS